MRLSILLTLTFAVSCAAINKSRQDFSVSKLGLRGGVSTEKEWRDELTFKRYTWYKEAVISYDILLSDIDSKSPFIDWMENDRSKMDGCSKFYIGLFYSKDLAAYSTKNLISMVEEQGFEAFIIPRFKDNFDAHPNSMDWEIIGHKMVGLCRTDSSSSSIKIKIPGFKTHKLK